MTDQLGFKKFAAMPTLFTHPEKKISLVIHVDDLLCASKRGEAKNFWNALGKWIEVKEFERTIASWRNRSKATLNQWLK